MLQIRIIYIVEINYSETLGVIIWKLRMLIVPDVWLCHKNDRFHLSLKYSFIPNNEKFEIRACTKSTCLSARILHTLYLCNKIVVTQTCHRPSVTWFHQLYLSKKIKCNMNCTSTPVFPFNLHKTHTIAPRTI